MLINGVDVNVKLTYSPWSLYLLEPSTDVKVRLKISDVTLPLRSNQIQPFTLLTQKLQTQGGPVPCNTHSLSDESIYHRRRLSAGNASLVSVPQTTFGSTVKTSASVGLT